MTEGGTSRRWTDAASWLGLEGRDALVTGAASGIGRAIAEALSALGVGIDALDVSEPPADFAAGPGAVRWHHADVRDLDGLGRIRDGITARGGRLDILIANAGVIVRRPLLELSPEEEERMVEVNLLGTMRTLRSFVPIMIADGGGRVVVTSSATAEHAMALRGAYAATKAGLSGLVRAAALEWGPEGVAVNAVGPGIIRTALTERYIAEHPERAEAARANVPLARLGTPQDVADVAVFLASPAAGFITGQTVMVDGGLTAGSSWW